MSSVERPTSPHLSIYRPQISSVLSILHRLTGLSLVAGTALLLTWLWSAAYAPNFYVSLHEWMVSMLGKILLTGWMFAFYFHLCTGIRHLIWDMGKGFTLPVMNRSGWAAVLVAFALTALTWYDIYSAAGQ